MAKVYVPEDFVSKPCVEIYGHNVIRVYDKKPALNPDLWERLLTLCEVHTLDIHWLKGHAGHPENELCDKMAVEESQRFLK